ncbi:MAG: c-type cytochrome [Gammaproteobacteria bacterium]
MKPVVLVALLLAAPVAFAQDVAKADPFTGGSVEAGASKAAVCGACHGPGGNSTNPEWPKLAGQHSAYTYDQLRVLKNKARPSPVMGPQAANLSDQDMRDLAAYFAAQKPSPGVASPDAVKTAQKLYRAGDAARGLPACSACHGPQGAGNAAAQYPRIGGQHSKYTATVLRLLRDLSIQRIPQPAGTEAAQWQRFETMSSIAARLTDAEIEALASYVNGLR